MATTIINSIRVKPDCFFGMLFMLKILFSMDAGIGVVDAGPHASILAERAGLAITVAHLLMFFLFLGEKVGNVGGLLVSISSVLARLAGGCSPAHGKGRTKRENKKSAIGAFFVGGDRVR